MDFVTSILPHNFQIIVYVAIGVVMIYLGIRSGNSKLVQKMLTDYKARNEQLEEILDKERKASEAFKSSMDKVVSDYKLEIVKLQTSNDEKDKHAAELKALLVDKNPEVKKVLEDVLTYLKSTHEQNTKMMDYQTQILEKWEKRSRAIDKASKKHKGVPMRVPLDPHTEQ